MIQLDSCAAIKLVVAEAESAALVDWLAERDEPIMASGLLRVELLRALTRVDAGEQSRQAAFGLLDRLHLHPVDAVLHDAALLEEQHLRSLDAIHLATALALPRMPTLITYDQRLADAAIRSGITVARPS